MKLSKFITMVVLVTAFSLFYVHQEIELVKQGYKVQLNQCKLNDLLDQNRTLQYNITALKAPFNLESQLAVNDIKLVSPERWQVVHVASSVKEAVIEKRLPSPLHNFFKFFTLIRIAQAKPID